MDHGKTLEVTLPSGRKVIIRETNGNDDEVLSNIGTAMNGDNVYNFLANIIVSTPKILAADILDWPLNDKLYLLFKQRLFNQGPEFEFTQADPSDKLKREETYTEDLSLVDGDLSNPNYKGGLNRVSKYPHGTDTHVEHITSRKNRYRIRIMTCAMEKVEIDIPQEKKSANTILTSRELELWENGQWVRQLSFHKIPSKEMNELRSWVRKEDATFNPMVEFKNIYTGNNFSIPIMSIPTFYFPEETI